MLYRSPPRAAPRGSARSSGGGGGAGPALESEREPLAYGMEGAVAQQERPRRNSRGGRGGGGVADALETGRSELSAYGRAGPRGIEHLWKSHWADKVVPQQKRLGLGGNRRARTRYSGKLSGADRGNFLRWEGDALTPAAGDVTARSHLSTGRRHLKPSRSAPVLDSPFASGGQWG